MAARDLKHSGMRVVKRRLIFDKSKKERRYRRIDSILNMSFFMEIILLFLAVYAVMGIFLNAYHIVIKEKIFYIGLFLFAVIFVVYHNSGKRYQVMIGFLAVQAGVIIFNYRNLVGGLKSVFNDMIARINMSYGGSLDTIHGNHQYKTMAMLVICFYLTGIIAKGMIVSIDCLHFVFSIFPFLLVSLVSGGNVPAAYYALLLMVFVTLLMMSKMQKRRNFLGVKQKEVYQNNTYHFGKIRYKLIMLGVLLCFITSIPAWYVGMSAKIPVIDELSNKMIPVRTGGIRFLADFLPKISGGKLKFSIEGIGGGSSGGILGEVEGTYYQKKETLKITVDEQPTETIYLKGYVGNIYTGNSWIYSKKENFISSASDWIKENEPSVYIQNLPFLRTMYAVNSGMIQENGFQPSTMKVENMNNEHAYTYIPYYAYINDYYVIQGGDGTIKGQNQYDDSFSFVYQYDYDTIMDDWKQNGTYGSLDGIENSYRYYVDYMDTQLGEADLSELEKMCQEKKEEWDAKFQSAVTAQQKEDLTTEKYKDIKNFVRKTLMENYEFEDASVKLPKGKDFIQYFTQERKKGDSTAFASTAVMMFRICGIPARYVEGYVVPTDLFYDSGNNSFTAILQDDNAHAWAEIYVPGKGFTYVETTPGFDGTVTNVELPEEEQEKQPDDTKEEEPTVSEILKENKSLIRYYVILGIFLFIMITGLVILIHYYLNRRRNLGLNRFRETNGEYRVKQIFTTIFFMLVYDGMDEEMDVTDESFISYTVQKYSEISESSMRKYMNMVIVTNYGGKEIADWYLDYSLDMYAQIRDEVYKNLKWHKKLVFKYWRAF